MRMREKRKRDERISLGTAASTAAAEDDDDLVAGLFHVTLPCLHFKPRDFQSIIVIGQQVRENNNTLLEIP